MLVVSYTTVSPLPISRRSVFCGTDPADYSGWALPTTLLCGVRTFLGAFRLTESNAVIRATHLGVILSKGINLGTGLFTCFVWFDLVLSFYGPAEYATLDGALRQ